MSVGNARDSVPVERIRQLVQAYMDTQQVPEVGWGGSGAIHPEAVFAARTGLTRGFFDRLLRRDGKTSVRFDTADRIVCALPDGPMLWRTDPVLSEIYETIDLTKARVSTGRGAYLPAIECAWHECGKTFHPHHKGTRFCSRSCGGKSARQRQLDMRQAA